MFTDVRSKRLMLVAHCVLNQNSISDGTAEFPASNLQAVNLLLHSQIGIIQMPCPELHCLGLARGNVHGGEQPVLVENSRIRSAMQRRPAATMLDRLAKLVALQVEEYRRYGFNVCGIVGIDRSPSCGVNSTSIKNHESRGEGVFIKAIRKELRRRHIRVAIVGIKASEIPKALTSIRGLLKHR